MPNSRWFLACAVATLNGCGGKENQFALDYTSAYCDYYLKCVDPALQVFDGIDTKDECEGTYGPPVADQAASCKLEKAAAKACLEQMSVLGCPSEDQTLDDALPSACSAVWKKCEGGDAG